MCFEVVGEVEREVVVVLLAILLDLRTFTLPFGTSDGIAGNGPVGGGPQGGIEFTRDGMLFWPLM